MSEAAPAAPFVWPICDLIEPSAHQGRSALSAAPKTESSDCISAASPAIVPVPWASISSTVSGHNPLLRKPFRAPAPVLPGAARKCSLIGHPKTRQSSQDGVNVIAIPLGVIEPAQRDHAKAFS